MWLKRLFGWPFRAADAVSASVGAAGTFSAEIGPRFEKVVLYTRQGCHLCEEAEEMLAHYRDWLPQTTLIDVDADSAAKARFDECVPVVEIDGKVRFKGWIEEVLLRRLIEGTRPLS